MAIESTGRAFRRIMNLNDEMKDVGMHGMAETAVSPGRITTTASR